MYETHIKRPVIALSIGFFVILILMSFLLIYTGEQVKYAYQQVENVIQVNNQKINLNYKMRVIGRERSIALQALFLLDDPFERDEAWMRYQAFAGEFITYRQQFLALSLSDWEKALLAEQDKHVRQTSRIQDEVGYLFFEGQEAKAKTLLLEEAMPAQNRVMESGYILIKKQEEHNAKVLADMYRSYHKELSILMILGVIIFSISIAIAVYLIANLGKLNKHLLTLITERTHDLQLAKEYAEKATESKSHYLAYVTHEIRNPLHGMLSLVELCLEDKLPKKSEEYLGTIQQSGEMLLLLLNDVLDLSKIEANKLSLEYLDFDLQKNVNAVVNLFRGRLQQQHLHLQVDLDPSLPKYIHGEPTRLKQIIINLMSNAIKFTQEEGLIQLRMYTVVDPIDEKEIKLYCHIKDSGKGISAENLSHLFQAYQQADETISRQFGGTGLGLLLCRQLVEMLNGKIWVESTVDEGSEFSFYVQCRQASVNAAPMLSSNKLEIPSPKLKRALLVEDNSVNRQVAALSLKKFIQHLDFSENGQEAVEACSKQQYDIIFMDCYMPVLDGFAATEKIRQIAHCQHVPIIAMTGSVTKEEHQRCLDVGMSDILMKPYKPHDLAETLKKHYR